MKYIALSVGLIMLVIGILGELNPILSSLVLFSAMLIIISTGISDIIYLLEGIESVLVLILLASLVTILYVFSLIHKALKLSSILKDEEMLGDVMERYYIEKQMGISKAKRIINVVIQVISIKLNSIIIKVRNIYSKKKQVNDK